METRFYKMLIKKAGGNASKGSKSYQISIPSKWAQTLGITEDERLVKLSFDGSSINISKVTDEDDCSHSMKMKS